MGSHVKALVGGVSVAGFGAVFYFTQVSALSPGSLLDTQPGAVRTPSALRVPEPLSPPIIPPASDRPRDLEGGPVLPVARIELYEIDDQLPDRKTQVDDPRVTELIQRFLTQHNGRASIGRLQQLADDLALIYRERGWILAAVQLPAQRISGQRAVLELVKGPLATAGSALGAGEGSDDFAPLPASKAAFAARSLAALPDPLPDAATAGGIWPNPVGPLSQDSVEPPRGGSEQLRRSFDDGIGTLPGEAELDAARHPLLNFPQPVPGAGDAAADTSPVVQLPADAVSGEPVSPSETVERMLVDGASQQQAAPEHESGTVIPRKSDRPLEVEEGPHITVQGIDLYQVRFLDGQEKTPVADPEILAQVDAYLSEHGERFSIGQLQQLADRLTSVYRQRGLVLATVYLPAQDVLNQRIEMNVLLGELARVVPEGQQSYTEEQLARPFEQVLGRPLEKDRVESALLTLLDYPGLQATGMLEPGDQMGTSQLALKVSRETPYQGSVYVDNYGSAFTGKERLGLGLGFNNPFGLIDRLQLDLLIQNKPADKGTGSVDHTLYGGISYSFKPIDPHYTFGVQVSHNSYEVGRELAAFEFTGETDQARVFATRQLRRSRTRNAFIETALAAKKAVSERAGVEQSRDRLTNFELAFGFDLLDRSLSGGYTEGQLRWVHGFEDLLGAMGEDAPDASRVSHEDGKADSRFDKLKFDVRRYQNLVPGTALVLRLNGQYSRDPLVSLEQFGLGGVTSVRAYGGAEYMADKGFYAGIELRANAPGFADAKAFNGRTWGQVLQLSAFVDYAKGYKNDALDSEVEEMELSGIGVAARLTPGYGLALNVSLATPLGSTKPSNGDDPQLYAEISWAF